MKTATIILLLGAGADLALAASTKTILNICRTGLGPSAKNPVPTTSRYLTIPMVARQWFTSTPFKVITLPPVTRTSTTTFTVVATTTAPVVTDTVDVISFKTSTVTVESTEARIISVTTTETSYTTVTTTGASSQGFLPVKSTVPNSFRKRRSSRVGKSNAVAEQPRAAPDPGFMDKGPNKFPTKVNCAGIVAVITPKTLTLTAKNTKIVTAPISTYTSVVSTTTTSTTAIIPPGAGVTNTITSSTQVTSTSTILTTSTTTNAVVVTSEVPVTVFAACSDDNIVHSVNGLSIAGISTRRGLQMQISQADARNPYECCVACITGSLCAVGVFYQNVCSLLSFKEGDTCSPDTQIATLSTQTGNGAIAYVSNGYCGRYYKEYS